MSLANDLLVSMVRGTGLQLLDEDTQIIARFAHALATDMERERTRLTSPLLPCSMTTSESAKIQLTTEI